MTTSGSYNFTVNRDELIKDVLISVGAVAQEDTPSSAIVNHASRQLNLMLKAWVAKPGFRLWRIKETTLFLEKAKRAYSLGPSGDQFTLSSDVISTTLSAAATASATTISLTSTTGMVAGDYIGIVLDDGTVHTTTIGVAATTTIVSGLASAASSGNVVWTYTSKAPRPNRIVDAFIRTVDNTDRPIRIYSRDEYLRMGDKFTSGSIVNLYYDPQLTNSVLKVWSPESIVTNTLDLTVEYPPEDMDSATDNFEFPSEWLFPVQWNLALILCPSYGVRKEQRDLIAALATQSLDEVMGFDKEETSIYLSPDYR